MQEFVIAPAARSVWLFALIPILIVALVSGLVGVSLVASRTARFEVSDAGLRLRGDYYGRLIPLDQLRPREARRVDLSSDASLRPARRTRGSSVPGYRSGWFKLEGGERALLYLTDVQRAVYVPTTEGYGVLLSPSDPDAFVAALRALPAAR